MKFIGIDFHNAIFNLINTLDRTISVGIGQAISINYIAEDTIFINATNLNNKLNE